MKPRTRKTLLTLATVLILTALAVISFHSTSLPSEPTYQGKSVDTWIDAMATPGSTQDYKKALSEIGPAAVPFIFRKLEQNDSPARNKYRDLFPKFPAFLQKHLPQPAPITFGSFEAGRALADCGINAIPLAIARLRDRNPAVREAAWQVVPNPHYQPVSTNQMISLCVPALRDTDALVRLHAANTLGEIGPSVSNLVPDIIPLLYSSEAGRQKSQHVYVHANTALALGKIGTSAAAAVPALTALMAGTNSYARVCAAVALWHITSNAAPSFAVLANELPGFDSNSKHLPISCLAEMGSQAKPAFPLLLAELPRARPRDTYLRGIISNALIAIDPQAAAQYFATQKTTNQ